MNSLNNLANMRKMIPQKYFPASARVRIEALHVFAQIFILQDFFPACLGFVPAGKLAVPPFRLLPELMGGNGFFTTSLAPGVIRALRARKPKKKRKKVPGASRPRGQKRLKKKSKKGQKRVKSNPFFQPFFDFFSTFF